MKHYDEPAFCLMQSALEKAIRDSDAPAEPQGPEGSKHMEELVRTLDALDDKRDALLRRTGNVTAKGLAKASKAKTCSEIYVKMALAHLQHRDADLERLKNEYEFSKCDPRFLEAMVHYLRLREQGSGYKGIPYVRHESLDDFVFDDWPDNLKVGVLGDWGTGTGEAMRVLDGLVALEPDVIIHLGDVYYSGDIEEFRSKLIEPMRQRAKKPDGTPIPVFNMAGNHDMYAGGEPFYEATRALNQDPALQQEASYFCLRLGNRKWQILCGDTGLHDHDPFTVATKITHLEPSEVSWHVHQVRTLDQRGGRTVFVTHHQPFSAFANMGSMARKKPTDFYVNPRLMKDFREIASFGDIPLWLWGHEHNLGIYEPFRGVTRGRCAGHSAVPVMAGEGDPYTVRRFGTHDRLGMLMGLVRGHWGWNLPGEIRAWRRMEKQAEADLAPELLKDAEGQPVKLGLSAPPPDATDDLDSTYEHGFTLLSFGQGEGGEGLRVEYFGDDPRSPRFSELI